MAEVVYGCLVAAMLACAILAIRARRLVVSGLWLALLSALLSVVFYLMGAVRVAVVELSVGAGLVTVLVVFAVGIVGDVEAVHRPLVPRVLMWGLSLVILGLLGWFVRSLVAAPAPASEPSLASLLWQGRTLDVWLQVVLIFCGVMGVLGLLAGAVPAGVVQGEPLPPVPRDAPAVEPAAREEPLSL